MTINNLKAILSVARSDNFIVISDKGYHTRTPKFGHKRYWAESLDIFKLIKSYADNEMKRSGGNPEIEKR